MPKGPQSDIQKKVKLECVRLSTDGSGVGYYEGKATFALGLLPGEVGEIEIFERKKNWQRGKLVNLLQASEDRVEAPCTVFGTCGGCQLQHLNYEKTLEWKRRWVEDNLSRIGKISLDKVKVHPTIGMDEPWRYRNKARMHRSKDNILGYYREKSMDVVRFSDCLLVSERMNKWIRQVEKVLSNGLFPEVKAVTFRENSNGEGIVIFDPIRESDAEKQKDNRDIVNGERIKVMESLEDIRAVWGVDSKGKPTLLYGMDDFTEEILSIEYKISPLAFLQVNPIQTQKLYKKALEWAEVSSDQVVWDLYSGIGTITLALARNAKKVWGIEENPYAVEDAKVNAELNHSSNIEFIAGKVEETFQQISDQPDVIVLDPPRAGVHKRVLERLIELKPGRIVYVSCDPGTLARDLGILKDGGYVVNEVQPVDMFAWTNHTESVCLLERM